MYGFHKINRVNVLSSSAASSTVVNKFVHQTPRAQRTSTDAQTWEFSHHKFLRGRPDLLDEIKRKALEPDPALKHRVELPGEVSSIRLSLVTRAVLHLPSVVSHLINYSL